LSIAPGAMANELTVTATPRRPAAVITPSHEQFAKKGLTFLCMGLFSIFLFSALPEVF
jgi:hypothetical protein